MTQEVQPYIAIVYSNTLAAIGLKQLLQSFLPMMVVDVFGSYAELAANHPNQYVHYFTDMNIVLENRDFFLQHRHKTIVLTISAEDNLLFPEFHSILVSVPEKGKANKELISFLAKKLGLAKSQITIVGGETDRYKKIRIQGDVLSVASKLNKLVGEML